MAIRSLRDLLTRSQPDYTEALRLLRHQDLTSIEQKERFKARNSGRCSICTLPIPCPHSSNLQEKLAKTPKKRLKMRYRSAGNVEFVYSERSESVPGNDEKHSRKHRKLLERLEKFKADRCEKEMRRIEELQKLQESERSMSLEQEKRRLEHAKHLKNRLFAYNTLKIQQEREKQTALLATLQQEEIKEKHRERYLERQVGGR